MGMTATRTAMIVALAASLAACGVKKTEDAGTGDTATPSSNPIAVPSPTPAPAPAAPTHNPVQAIQSQPGPYGSTASLERVAVTGNVLTVQLRITGGERNSRTVDVVDVSVIDDATSNRLAVLKDTEGKWMASDPTGSVVSVLTGREGGEVLWFKFPAPPATSPTVSINIPGIAPFDGVPVTR